MYVPDIAVRALQGIYMVLQLVILHVTTIYSDYIRIYVSQIRTKSLTGFMEVMW